VPNSSAARFSPYVCAAHTPPQPALVRQGLALCVSDRAETGGAKPNGSSDGRMDARSALSRAMGRRPGRPACERGFKRGPEGTPWFSRGVHGLHRGETPGARLRLSPGVVTPSHQRHTHLRRDHMRLHYPLPAVPLPSSTRGFIVGRGCSTPCTLKVGTQRLRLQLAITDRSQPPCGSDALAGALATALSTSLALGWTSVPTDVSRDSQRHCTQPNVAHHTTHRSGKAITWRGASPRA